MGLVYGTSEGSNSLFTALAKAASGKIDENANDYARNRLPRKLIPCFLCSEFINRYL